MGGLGRVGCVQGWEVRERAQGWCAALPFRSRASPSPPPPPPHRLPAEEWRPWEPPVLRLPEWCDRVSAKHGNQGFTRLRQHPCAFLRNASLAAEAADDSGPYNTGWEPH